MSSTVSVAVDRRRASKPESSTSDACDKSVRMAPAGFPLRAINARSGDHTSIHAFLLSVSHQPSPSEFHAQLEEPLYEPTDRLLVKRGKQIVSHLRMIKRTMHFGTLQLPVTWIADVATLPEFRRQGCASTLLKAAEQQMVEEGSRMGMLRTADPKFYARRGWVVCGRHSFSTASPRNILSHLSARELPSSEVIVPNQVVAPADRLNIRLWRHVEESALVRLYEENTQGTFGPLVRGEAYWRWLVSRRAYDRIYVAINGPDKFELDEALAPIVGYAATKESRIVELMTAAEHPDAAAQLLARACGDAIEGDHQPVRLDAPSTHPLHKAFTESGGKQSRATSENGHVFMVKLFEPLKLLARLCPQIHERAKASDLTLPTELGLQIDDAKYRLVLSRRSAKLVPDRLGRSYLICNSSQLTQLLLGHLDVQEAADSDRLKASTRVAVDIASMLFPRLPCWFPPLDDLLAP